MTSHKKTETPHAGMEKGRDELPLKTSAQIAAERSSRIAATRDSTALPAKELEELRAQADKAKEHWDLLLRAQADLENYRKRVMRERQDLLKTANEKLLLDLLAPLDHFEMGLATTRNAVPDDPLRQGMEMVLTQFQQFLKSQGVTEIQAVGQPFNPGFHEAIAHQESDLPEGQVVQQLRKGYRLSDKVLRPATVVVSKGHPSHATDGTASDPALPDTEPTKG